MKIRNDLGLPIITVILHHQNKQLKLDTVVLDTGSAGSIFKMSKVAEIGLKPEPEDKVRRITGVGGSELVYVKKVGKLSVDKLKATNFNIEIGTMDYGVDIDGIIGMDFLIQTAAIIDLKNLTIK
jgi:hypothetical protein